MWWRTTATLAIRTHKGGARVSNEEHGVLSTRGYRPVILFVVSRVSPRGGSPPRRVRPCGRHRIRAEAAMSVGSGEGGQQDKCRGRRPGVAAPSGTAKHGVLEPSSSVRGIAGWFSLFRARVEHDVWLAGSSRVLGGNDYFGVGRFKRTGELHEYEATGVLGSVCPVGHDGADGLL